MKKSIVISSMLLAIISSLYAQNNNLELLLPSDSYYQSDQTSYSWVLGEIVTGSYSSNSYGIVQGFIKSLEVIQDSDDDRDRIFNVSIMPNPARDRLILDLNFTSEENLIVDLTDLSGRVLHSSKFQNNVDEKEISISYLKSGTYIIRVRDTENTLLGTGTFVVLKP